MAFRTVDEFLALTGEERPTPAEMRLVKAVRAGERYEISRELPEMATRENTVRASLLRLLITGATPNCGTQDFGVWLAGAWITGVLDLQFARARGMTLLPRCHFTEKPVLAQAKLRQLSLAGSRLPGLFAQGMRVEGSLFLRKMTSTGTLDVNAAKVGGYIDCNGASFDGAGGDALNAQGVETGAGLYLNQVEARGTVVVAGAKIGGHMPFDGATFDGVGASALVAQRLQVGQGLIWRDVTVKAGLVMLLSAQVGDLVDDGRWPGGKDALNLDGFIYDRITGNRAPVTAEGRRAWLQAGSVWESRFYPQPYTQLARVLRNMGHGGEARTVLYWREGLVAAQVRRDLLAAPLGTRRLGLGRVGRRVLAAGHWAAELFWWGVAGYGYRPFRTLGCLFVLWLAAFAIADQVWRNGQFAPNSDVVLTSAGWQAALDEDCFPAAKAVPGCEGNPANTWSSDPQRGMDWESFSAMGYALDLVVPILDLGQTDAWAPSKDRGNWGWGLWWGRWWFEAFGWLVTALGAAAVTGIMQRERE